MKWIKIHYFLRNSLFEISFIHFQRQHNIIYHYFEISFIHYQHQ